MMLQSNRLAACNVFWYSMEAKDLLVKITYQFHQIRETQYGCLTSVCQLVCLYMGIYSNLSLIGGGWLREKIGKCRLNEAERRPEVQV